MYLPGNFISWSHVIVCHALWDLSEYSWKASPDIGGEILAKSIVRSLPSLWPKTAQSIPFYYQRKHKVPGNLFWNPKKTFQHSHWKSPFQDRSTGTERVTNRLIVWVASAILQRCVLCWKLDKSTAHRVKHRRWKKMFFLSRTWRIFPPVEEKTHETSLNYRSYGNIVFAPVLVLHPASSKGPREALIDAQGITAESGVMGRS